MLFNQRSDAVWEILGRTEPYYGVITRGRFRRAQLDEPALHEFFQSGREHVEFVLGTIRNHLMPAFSPTRALDFGCGVGRCLVPLSAVCPAVVGVDVSDAMLAEARKNCDARSAGTVELAQADDALSQVSGPFDLVHSFLVFQHIPQKRGTRILRRLLGLLAPDGIGALQFLYSQRRGVLVPLVGSARKWLPGVNYLANLYFRKPLTEPRMEKNVYSLGGLFAMLQESGCGNVHVALHGAGEFASAFVFFQKRPDLVPYDAYDRD